MGWIIFAGYLVCGLIVGRRVNYMARIAIEEDNNKHKWAHSQGDDWLAACLGFAGMVGWPIAAILLFFMFQPKKTPGEVEAELKAAAKKVADLEKELGIR